MAKAEFKHRKELVTITKEIKEVQLTLSLVQAQLIMDLMGSVGGLKYRTETDDIYYQLLELGFSSNLKSVSQAKINFSESYNARKQLAETGVCDEA